VLNALWDENGDWFLFDSRERQHTAELLCGGFVSAPLVILSFRLDRPWRRRHLLLTWDSLDADLLRKLRVRLKFERAQAADHS
jgi:hypothetical protein